MQGYETIETMTLWTTGSVLSNIQNSLHRYIEAGNICVLFVSQAGVISWMRGTHDTSPESKPALELFCLSQSLPTPTAGWILDGKRNGN